MSRSRSSRCWRTPFTVENQQMTLKLSLRRKVIEAAYAKEIEAMYAPASVATAAAK